VIICFVSEEQMITYTDTVVSQYLERQADVSEEQMITYTDTMVSQYLERQADVSEEQMITYTDTVVSQYLERQVDVVLLIHQPDVLDIDLPLCLYM
jgi:uncharacterized protein YozE (UPF0346 family)